MTTKGLTAAYFFFFFMYFIGFGLMGNMNAGVPFPWEELVKPFSVSRLFYTVLTVLLAHFIVFRRLYYSRPGWKVFAGVAGLLLFFIIFRYLLEEMLIPSLFGYRNYNPHTSFRYYAVDNIYFGSIIILIGFVFFLFDEMFRNQKRQAALLEQNKLAELNFLQAQMNPHFLFNSLNNIYSLAYRQHPQTANAIMKLSDMMRYVTYERAAGITLAKEIEYIQSLIEIDQLRHDFKLQVKTDISPSAAAAAVMPLTLVPLVENALKHGDLSDANKPLVLTAAADEKKLTILLLNKISTVKINTAGGVGLKNLQRRLELTYKPGSFVFEIKKDADNFTVNLTIPL